MYIHKLLSSEVVMCVWSVAPISGRDESKYSSTDHGALSLTLTGPVKIHRLSVAPWDTSDLVRFTATIIYKSCASESVILQEKLQNITTTVSTRVQSKKAIVTS